MFFAQKQAVVFVTQGKTTGQTPNVPNQHAAPSQIEDGKKQLNAAASQLEDGMKQIADNEKKLDDSQAQISAGREQLASAQKQLDDAQAQLKDGYAQAEVAGSPSAMVEQLDAQQAQLTE